MRIAYIENPFDHSKISAGGVSKYIIRALEKNGITIQTIQLTKRPLLSYLYNIYSKLISLFGKKYQPMRSPILWRAISKKMSATISEDQYDAVLAFGSLPIAYFSTSKPIYFWTDAVFESLIDYYPDYTNLTKQTIKNGHALDAKAFERAEKAFICTQIEIKQAEKYYSHSDKIYFAPFGANLDEDPDQNMVDEIIARKKTSPIKFLLIGWDWYRKGGDKALELVQELNRKGHQAELHIIGQEQGDNIKDPALFFHGKLRKDIPEEKEKFIGLLSEATFLVHFSKAETYGHVLCEANAYGLPAITSNTGGIKEVINDEVNGHKFDEAIPVNEISEQIISIISDEKKYKSLCHSSNNEYHDRLNWDKAVKILIEEIQA